MATRIGLAEQDGRSKVEAGEAVVSDPNCADAEMASEAVSTGM